MTDLSELKYSGYSIDRWNYAEYEYKGLDITFHLTVMGSTRLRLERYKDDEARWKLYCDWCLGNEPLISDGYLIIGFALFIYCIDNHLTEQLPFCSNPRPIFNDDKFMEWLNEYMEKMTKTLVLAVRDRIVKDVDRAAFVKTCYKIFK